MHIVKWALLTYNKTIIHHSQSIHSLRWCMYMYMYMLLIINIRVYCVLVHEPLVKCT